jgi:hypothetical protein
VDSVVVVVPDKPNHTCIGLGVAHELAPFETLMLEYGMEGLDERVFVGASTRYKLVLHRKSFNGISELSGAHLRSIIGANHEPGIEMKALFTKGGLEDPKDVVVCAA